MKLFKIVSALALTLGVTLVRPIYGDVTEEVVGVDGSCSSGISYEDETPPARHLKEASFLRGDTLELFKEPRLQCDDPTLR
jgi:hypothetical protein